MTRRVTGGSRRRRPQRLEVISGGPQSSKIEIVIDGVPAGAFAERVLSTSNERGISVVWPTDKSIQEILDECPAPERLVSDADVVVVDGSSGAAVYRGDMAGFRADDVAPDSIVRFNVPDWSLTVWPPSGRQRRRVEYLGPRLTHVVEKMLAATARPPVRRRANAISSKIRSFEVAESSTS